MIMIIKMNIMIHNNNHHKHHLKQHKKLYNNRLFNKNKLKQL